MAHKKQNTDGQIKTFSFKVIADNELLDKFENTIDKYIAGYNKVSKFIAERLDTLTLGEIADVLEKNKKPKNDENGGDTKYLSFCKENADAKLFKLFTKVKRDNKMQDFCGGQYMACILYYYFKYMNVFDDCSNPIGITITMFNLQGYLANVLENYKSKFANFKLSVLKRKSPVSVESSDEDKAIRVMYERQKRKNKSLNTEEEWDDTIKWAKEIIEEKKKDKEKENAKKYLNEMILLKDFALSHEQYIDDLRNQLTIDELKSFCENGGCNRSLQNRSMNFKTGDQRIIVTKDSDTHNELVVKFDKTKIPVFHVMGNRMFIKDNEFVVDIDTVRKNATFVIKTDKHCKRELFVHLQASVPFKKEEIITENAKVVGCDINTKHFLMATNIKDNGNVSGYVNIYKALLEDVEFVSLAKSMHKLAEFRTMSEFCTFGFLETDFLFARYANYSHKWNLPDDNLDVRMDKCVNRVLNSLAESAKDTRTKLYIQRTMSLRKKIIDYFVMNDAFRKFKGLSDSKYQEEVNKKYADAYSEIEDDKDRLSKRQRLISKELSDLFNSTDVAQQILEKKRGIEREIIATRNRIVEYTRDFLVSNGYNQIALEYLDSSSLDKYKFCKSPKYFIYDCQPSFIGMTIDEARNDEDFRKKEDCYDVTFDDNNKIANIEWSSKGLLRNHKSLFCNVLIKSVHFADIKDHFVTLSNNGQLQVALVSPELSSQIDSLRHQLYTERYVSNDGEIKERRAPKSYVRPQQEFHINGLNADFNSACNLAYYLENKDWKKKFLRKNEKWKEFSQPIFKPSSENFEELLFRIKEIGATYVINADETLISKKKITRKSKKINSL